MTEQDLILVEKYGKSLTKEYYLKNWQLLRKIRVKYAQWTDTELEAAKKRPNGYIGEKCFVRCYLTGYIGLNL